MNSGSQAVEVLADAKVDFQFRPKRTVGDSKLEDLAQGVGEFVVQGFEVGEKLLADLGAVDALVAPVALQPNGTRVFARKLKKGLTPRPGSSRGRYRLWR